MIAEAKDPTATGCANPLLRGRSGHGLPGSWPFLMLCMLATITSGIIAVGGFPPAAVTALLLASLVSAGGVPLIVGRMIESYRFVRIAAGGVLVSTPLFLFGLAITLWTTGGALPWDMALAALICVGAIASAYLRKHPAMVFVGQLSIWFAAILVLQSLAGALALVVALVIAVVFGRDELREQEREEGRRQMQERAHARARDILREYEETRQGWFWETDRHSYLTYVSAPIAKSLGVKAVELLGRPLVELFDLRENGQENERTLRFHLTARSPFSDLAVRAAIAVEERWWAVSGRPIFDDFGNFVGFRGSGTDLTEMRRSREEASRLALYDSLTGLANRHQMSQALEKILAAPRGGSRACSVLLIDLDRFKRVNDTMGHPAGDALLKQVAMRLQRSVGQMGQVGRLGGDEFQIVIPGTADRKVLGELAQEIISSVSQPYAVQEQRVIIGASVGIAISPDDGTTRDELIRNADLALYAAKDSGRGKFHYYSEDLHTQVESRAQMEQDLRDAIVQGKLELFYQPVISTASERISGFEALLRWRHPQKGWIPAHEIVAAAEESGLIAQIGEWALRTACADLAHWPEEVRVAVNVSPLQFANSQLPAIVTNAIAQAGIAPSRLELEITESVFLNDDDINDAMFAALKRIGVRLALDDFGTGYSSLGYLKKAPFDKIKIDQSFVRGATQSDSRNGAIIASITSLAQALGMDTTAEGVETLDELELVRLHGCSHVQGFIYDRPLTAQDATARVQAGLSVSADGPRSAREPRQTVLRKVTLDHRGHLYHGTIRNVSSTGAMVEGLWNVPEGTVFTLRLSDRKAVDATTRWCHENRMGIEFAAPIERDMTNRVPGLLDPPPPKVMVVQELRAG